MTDELDGAVQELYPVPAGEAEALRRARARAIPVVRRRRWPQLSLAAAVLAAAVITVAVRGNAPDGAMVEVAQTLNIAADAQMRAVDEPVPVGWYRYIATHAVNAGFGPGVVVLVGTKDERWVPADPAGEWFMQRAETGERTRLLGTEAQVKEAGLDIRRNPERLSGRCGAFYPGVGDRCAAEGNWQDPTAAFIAGLPRDPRRLYDRLRADSDGHGQDADQEVLVYAADSLRSGLLPAELRAALYRALTYLPTLAITERTTTLDGRTGRALGITAAGEHREIIIDPATGAFIGERNRLAEDQDGLRAGTVISSSTVLYDIVQQPWARPTN